MDSWLLAASFDSAFGLRRDGTTINELHFTRHSELRTQHYVIARDLFGFQKFRDGIHIEHVLTPRGLNLRQVDELATISMHTGTPSVDLILHHYGIPGVCLEDLQSGKAEDMLSELAYTIGKQFTGCFSGYVVGVELGYGIAMMTTLQQWRYSCRTEDKELSWWELYEQYIRIAIAMAKAFRESDPNTGRTACEPFYFNPNQPFSDQVRSQRSLLGYSDPAALLWAPSKSDAFGGDTSLLTRIGLNWYGNANNDPAWPLSRVLTEARQWFPEHELFIAETGNCQVAEQYGISVEEWLQLLDEQVTDANNRGVGIHTVTWAPFLQIEKFETAGVLAPGALVRLDPHTRLPIVDKATQKLARIVRNYTNPPTTETNPAHRVGLLFYSLDYTNFPSILRLSLLALLAGESTGTSILPPSTAC